MTSRVPVLVCGEPARGDDAAGLAAIELLDPAVLARAQVVEVGMLDVQHLLDVVAGTPCVVVDAVAGLAPGEVWVQPLAALVERARSRVEGPEAAEPRSSHVLPVEQVVALAATLLGSPPAGTFVGIGGVRWELGAPLSTPVADALPAFAAAIAAAVEAPYCG